MKRSEEPNIPQPAQRGGANVTDKARRILALIQDPKRRAKVMDELNDANPPSGPSTSQQGMTILKDINEFEDDHERFMDSLKGVVDG